MAPQLKVLLSHFAYTGSISDGEARLIHRIRALPRRISDLEELGYKFTRTVSLDAAQQRYTRYHLVSPETRAA